MATDDDLERIQEASPEVQEVSDVEHEALVLQARVKEALLTYKGADKGTLKAQCISFANSRKVDPEFWRRMLSKLTANPEAHPTQP